MHIAYPPDTIGRRAEWGRLTEFIAPGADHASLGIVWGRRRVGKSFLLESLVRQTGGFYYAAVRGSSAEALREIGERIAEFQGVAAPLALESWDSAIAALLSLGDEREIVVVLDEYPYLLEHSPDLDSIIQRAFGPGSGSPAGNATRMILCGSAMSVMKEILSGTAPLRGRAGMDLRISPFDFRVARELHGLDDLETAFRTYAVIGGVAAYAREMAGYDLPRGPGDFDRWVCQRVLSPSAPLFNEVTLLLSEDPATARARKPNLYHATLAGVAKGNTTHRDLTSYVKIPGNSLAPIVEALVAAQLVDRLPDPVRDNRPSYHPDDPLIRFHYAVIRKHQSRLARHGADTAAVWRAALPTFGSQVIGPTFEAMARYWTQHFADPASLGGDPAHVGTTVVHLEDGNEREIDVLVAADDGATASDRTVLAMGEAKSGERLGTSHLRRLEETRGAMGARAENARLLIFGVAFSPELASLADRRRDVELIGLERLYGGS